MALQSVLSNKKGFYQGGLDTRRTEGALGIQPRSTYFANKQSPTQTVNAVYGQTVNAGMWPQAASPAQSGAMGGMSGGGAFDANSLYGDYQSKYNTARTDNINRYNDILGQYGDRYNRGMTNLEGLGNQELADIRQAGEANKASINQNMTNFGLGGTTVGSTLQQGATRETNADLGRAQERIRQQRLSTDANLSKDKLDFMERRNDEYPDFGAYASLMGSMGSLQGQGGGAYGAGGTGAGSGLGTGPLTSGGNGAYGESVINSDMGLRQPIFKRQPNGSTQTYYRTQQEDALARNPFLLGG